jgi:hypothetical protein
LAPRRGTPSACAFQAHAPDARAEMPLALRGRVLHSVQRPVRVNRYSTSSAQAGGGGAFASISRSGKPAQAGGTGTGIETSGRSAARRGSPLPQGSSVIRQNRKGVVAPVPARIVSSGSCPHVVKRSLQKSVGDVWSRISSANALPKERTGSSEQGPRSGRSSARERRCARRAKGRRAVGLYRTKRTSTGTRPRVT